jgi:hypothetical protein
MHNAIRRHQKHSKLEMLHLWAGALKRSSSPAVSGRKKTTQCKSAQCSRQELTNRLSSDSLPSGSKKGKSIRVTGRGGPQSWETSRVPHFLDSCLTDGGEVVSLTRRGRPLPPGRFLVLISVRGWVDPRAIVRLEEFDQLKNPMPSSGFEPATFRLEE